MIDYFYVKFKGERKFEKFIGGKKYFDSIVAIFAQNNKIIEETEPVNGYHVGIVNYIDTDKGDKFSVSKVDVLSARNLNYQKKSKTKVEVTFTDGTKFVIPVSKASFQREWDVADNLFSEKFVLVGDVMIRKIRVKSWR